MFSACQSIPGLWYCPDLDGSFGTNVKFGNNLILSHRTLPATVHKFLLLCNHLKLQLYWFLIQYCNMTWSYFITCFKWFYTENEHNLPHLKYTNKERERDSDHQAHGVRSACMVCMSFGFTLVFPWCFGMYVFKCSGQIYPLVREGVRYCFIIIGKFGVWTICLYSCDSGWW
jgi:hypothetical protein